MKELGMVYRLGKTRVYGRNRMTLSRDEISRASALVLLAPGLADRAIELPRLPLIWRLPVDDGRALNWSLTDYCLLAKTLATLRGNTYVACFGGHGRTGTMLVALAYAGGVIPPGVDAVKWIRARYSHEAVETRAQIEHLRNLGIRTSAKPSYERDEWPVMGPRVAAGAATVVAPPQNPTKGNPDEALSLKIDEGGKITLYDHLWADVESDRRKSYDDLW